MKVVIKEYASTICGLFGTIGILTVIGSVMLHERGLLCRMIQFVIEGGI